MRGKDVTEPKVRVFAYVGVLTLAGLSLLWWANEQLLEVNRITASEFHFPKLRLLWWVLTLVLAGLVFGLAATWRSSPVSSSRKAIAIWSVLPLLMLVWFYSTLAFSWPVLDVSVRLLRFVTSQTTVTAVAVVLGFNLAVLVAPVIATRESPQEPPDRL
jgi:hypothetical protein